jgi:hypothetical protein
VQETQDDIRTALSNLVDQNGPADAALLSLTVRAAVFAVGQMTGHPTAKWWTTGAQTIGLLSAMTTALHLGLHNPLRLAKSTS